MQKLKPREWFLVLVPLVFAAGAAILQFRPDTAKKFGDVLRPPPIFYAEMVQFVPLMPREVADGYDRKVEVVLNHSGPQPPWWNKQNSAAISYNKSDKLVLQRGKKSRSLAGPLYVPPYVWAPLYNQKRERYIAHYLLRLAPLPVSDDDVVLKANLAVGMMDSSNAKPVSPVVPITFVVRRAGQTIKVPKVSRQTGLLIEQVLVMKFSAAEMKASMTYDTRVRVVFKRQAGGNTSSQEGISEGSVILKNEIGHELLVYALGPSIRDAFDGSYGIPATRPDERYFCDYDFAFPKNKPRLISMKNAVSLHGAWPLEYEATIYDATRAQNFGTTAKPHQVAFSQRPAPRK